MRPGADRRDCGGGGGAGEGGRTRKDGIEEGEVIVMIVVIMRINDSDGKDIDGKGDV